MTTVLPARPRPARLLRAAALAASAVVLSGGALAACSGGSAPQAAHGATSSTPAPSTPAPSTPARGATSAPDGASGPATSSTSPGAGTRNVVVTAEVRAQLLQAGAAMNGLPATAYTGLVPGTTYYAYDAATATYWAGAGLVPSPASERAQVSVQDDGSYVLFDRPAEGTWRARPVGLGSLGGSSCPADLPAPVVALWNWAPGTCRPRG